MRNPNQGELAHRAHVVGDCGSTTHRPTPRRREPINRASIARAVVRDDDDSGNLAVFLRDYLADRDSFAWGEVCLLIDLAPEHFECSYLAGGRELSATHLAFALAAVARALQSGDVCNSDRCDDLATVLEMMLAEIGEDFPSDSLQAFLDGIYRDTSYRLGRIGKGFHHRRHQQYLSEKEIERAAEEAEKKRREEKRVREAAAWKCSCGGCDCGATEKLNRLADEVPSALCLVEPILKTSDRTGLDPEGRDR